MTTTKEVNVAEENQNSTKDASGPFQLKRSDLAGALTQASEGQEVTVAGWVDTRRDLGGIVFIACLVASSAHADDALAAKIAGADVGYGEYLAGECVTCHQKSGVSRGIPSIAGIDGQTFVSIMTAYRKKELDNKVMQMVAGRLDDEQIVALAAYFSKLSPN